MSVQKALEENGSKQEKVNKSNFLDPDAPRILSQYLQLIFNAALASLAFYLLVRFVQLIHTDVQLKLKQKSMDLVQAALQCAREYERNGCEPSKRVPALEAQCNHWYRCMNNQDTDTRVHQRAQLWAQTLAEIINAFAKPISIKALCFVLLIVCGTILVTNVAFGTYRIYYHGLPSSADIKKYS